MIESKKIKISSLKRHPKQDIYLDEPKSKIQKLAADIKRNGQRVPIEISQDGVIIDGHCRLEAIKSLDQKTILAVQIDVEDDNELRQRHLEANINRRHLERIDQVRLIKAQLDLEGEVETFGQDELRVRIAKAFDQDKSDPTVRRYHRLVRLPDLIQELFKRKELRLMTALKFDRLSSEKQEELLETLREKKLSPKLAFEQYFPPKQVVESATENDDATEDQEEDYNYETCSLTPHEALEQIANCIGEDVVQLRDEIVDKLPNKIPVNGQLKAELRKSKEDLGEVIERLDRHQDGYRAFRNETIRKPK